MIRTDTLFVNFFIFMLVIMLILSWLTYIIKTNTGIAMNELGDAGRNVVMEGYFT